MGNTNTAGSSNANRSYKIHIGSYASAQVNETKSNSNELGERVEKQSVSYQVHARFCDLKVTKTTPPNKGGHKFNISVYEFGRYNFEMEVQIAQDGGDVIVNYARVHETLLTPRWFPIRWKNVHTDLTENKTSKTTADGNITETSHSYYDFAYHGIENGLVVIECKKRASDQSPYLVTVAHYFVSSGMLNTKHAGLSMLARFGGDTCLELEGPTQHPRLDLLRLIEDVKRSGCWTPTSCPHCNTSMTQGVPTNQGLVFNNGVTIGNGNGSLYFSAENMEFYRGGKHVVKY